MKLLLVDLDDTLIDTATFKRSFFERLALVYELEYEKISEMYEEYKNKIDTNDWINDFTMAFDQEIWFSSKDIPRMGLSINVNKEILDFVTHFSGEKIIFSYGNEKLQQAKIDAAKLRDVFRKVVVTHRDKFTVLEEWISGDHALSVDGSEYTDIVVIDDNEKFVEKIRANYPWIITALVKNGTIQNTHV